VLKIFVFKRKTPGVKTEELHPTSGQKLIGSGNNYREALSGRFTSEQT
jgi:hypothetical protein